MMPRRPEPEELMDDPAQARAYAEADFSEPHQGFVDAFGERFPEARPRQVLDLGCGPADITLRFARRYPESRCVGLDAAPAMLTLGRDAVSAAGMTARVELREGYLPGATPASAAFDTILCNSLLHHMAQPEALWETIRQAGRPGARILVMDLLRPADPKAAAALVATYAAGAPPILRRDFHNSLHAAFTAEEVAGQIEAAGLARVLRVEVISDRHWLAWGRLPEAPPFANGRGAG